MKLAVVLCLLMLSHTAGAQDPAWRIEPDAYGPARIGMTHKALEAALGQRLKAVYPDAENKQACYYLSFPRSTSGVGFMMLKGRLARIHVSDTAKVSTAAGAAIGDTEERIKALYPDRVAVTPHHYIRPTGHYLTIIAEDRRHAILFETDGRKVVSFSSGERNALKRVEGCS